LIEKLALFLPEKHIRLIHCFVAICAETYQRQTSPKMRRPISTERDSTLRHRFWI
jgi:hypothetical protein